MAAQGSSKQAEYTSPEQHQYSRLLFWGSWLAIVILLITYAIYVFGVVEPYIPHEKIPQYWSMASDEYVHKADAPVGWEWTSLLNKGDYLNFVGVVLLAGMTIICFIICLIPGYIKQKDPAFLIISILEVAVLVLAASGILGGGGH